MIKIFEKSLGVISITIVALCFTFVIVNEYKIQKDSHKVIVKIKLKKDIDPYVGINQTLGNLKYGAKVKPMNNNQREYEVTLRTHLLPEQLKKLLLKPGIVEKIIQLTEP